MTIAQFFDRFLEGFFSALGVIAAVITLLIIVGIGLRMFGFW